MLQRPAMVKTLISTAIDGLIAREWFGGAESQRTLKQTSASALPPAASSPLFLVLLSATLLALDWALFVRPGATYVTIAPGDFFQLADLMLRMDGGQMLHVDFHAPMGWLAFWLPHVGRMAQGGFAGALEFADMLMLGALLPLAVTALSRRAPTGASVFVLLALFGIVAAPWRMGESGWLADPGLHYNHWGWGLLLVILLFGLPKATDSGRRFILDATAIGALLSMLFFVKITHFVVGLGFVVLFGAALGEFRRAACVGLAICTACILGVQAIGGWVDDYALDIFRTVEVARFGNPEDGGFTSLTAPDVIFAAYGDIALIAVVCAAAAFSGRLSPRSALYAVYSTVACTAVMTQNAAYPSVMFAFTAFFVRLAAECPPKSVVRRLALLAMVMHLLPTLLRQALASVVFMLGTSGGFPQFAADLPRMEGVWFGGPSRAVNAFAEGVPQWRSPADVFNWSRKHGSLNSAHLSTSEYLETLRTGIALLQAEGAGEDRVMTLDFANPFPALLGAPSPKGVLFSLFVNRQVDRRTAADPDLVFGDAQWLMVPRFPYKQESNRLLADVQSERLASEWKQVAENEHWRLLRRSDGSTSGRSQS